MIEMVIRREGESERRLKLGDGVFGIGRQEGNEIRLDDKEVSRKHARVLIDGDLVVVEDLGSGNGTFLAGKQVTNGVVAMGDEIEILPFVMVVQAAGTGDAVEAPTAELIGVEGPDTGKRFPLRGATASIGRGADQDVHLSDKGASRAHGRFERRGGAWSLVDNDSANGVFLNDEQVTDAVLSHGDLVALGNSVLRFEVLGAARPAAPVTPPARPAAPVAPKVAPAVAAPIVVTVPPPTPVIASAAPAAPARQPAPVAAVSSRLAQEPAEKDNTVMYILAGVFVLGMLMVCGGALAALAMLG